LEECTKGKIYIKNFTTFLNNLPDLPEQTRRPTKSDNGEEIFRVVYSADGKEHRQTQKEIDAFVQKWQERIISKISTNQHDLPEKVKTSTCPLCSAERKKSRDKCLSLHWDTGLGVCHHCGEILQLHTYKRKNSDKPYKKPQWKNNTDLSEGLVKWFEGRKIGQFALRRLKVSEGKEWMPQTKKEENTVQFNYFRDDELINIKFRDGRKNFKMVSEAEKILYNIDNARTNSDIVIVEGEMDVLSYVEAGVINTVSIPNGSTKNNVNLEYIDSCIDYLDNKEKIYLALDSDEAGQNTQKEIIRRLGAERCYLVDLGAYKDANELLCAEGAEALKNTIIEAQQVPLSNVETFADFDSELEDYFDNGEKKGFQIGLNSFDDKFSTYTSQYIMVTGIPSHGKSEWVDMMTCGYNRKYGWKIAYASPENKPNKHHGRKIFKKFAGYEPTSRAEYNTEKSKKVREYLNDNFFFIEFNKGYDLEETLSKAKELVVRKGVKCIVLDPFNKIRLKGVNRSDINVYTEEYLTRIDNFCKEWDVLVIIVAHPVKMKKINGITPEVDFYDVKGGGEWYDMSYHGLSVVRDFDRRLVKIKVLKVKFDNLGTNQAEMHFSYNVNNGRYSEIRGDASDISIDPTPIWDNSYWLEEKAAQELIDYSEPSFQEVQDQFDMEERTPPF